MPAYDVPIHLRNAPEKIIKEPGLHKGYKYAQNFDKHFSDMQYFPDELKNKIYYYPTGTGGKKKFKPDLINSGKKDKENMKKPANAGFSVKVLFYKYHLFRVYAIVVDIKSIKIYP